MKHSAIKAVLAIALLGIVGTAGAGSRQGTPQKIVTNASTAERLKVLQAKVTETNERLKKQATRLNQTYQGVTPEVQESLNDREDSIYISLLSEKRNFELEIAEIAKAANSGGSNTVVVVK